MPPQRGLPGRPYRVCVVTMVHPESAKTEPASESLLAGAVVRDVRQPAPHEIVLSVYHPATGASDWVLSTHPECPRLLRTFRRPRNAPQPPIFCQWLRSRIEGARLDAPRLLAPQVLAIDAEDAAGTRHRLVLEANGDESNLLLLDGDGRLLIALRHPALPGRKLAPGDPYALPVKPRALPPGVPNELWAARAWDRSGGEAGARDWDARAREQEAGSSLEQQSRAARQQVRAELKKLRRRIEKQRDDLARAEEAEALRRFGELLKIHRARLAFGMADIVVPDEFDPARPDVTIALDPRLGPAENIERYFQRYRKLRAALPHIQSRLEEAEARLQGWEDAQTALDRIDSAQALAELFARLNLPSPVAKQAGGARRTRTSEPVGESHVLTRTSADGLTVLVGRSKEANDRVTFRLGNGRDWWFHAQGVPGSHVIVRSPSGAPPPERTVREAAWLAAYYSQRRQEGRVDVDYTQRKHVRKIKGAEPGQVTYSQNKTVLVDLSDTKASAILGETGD